jgi:hypothetical protein
MALDQDQEQENNRLSDADEEDLEIAVLLGKRLVDQGGQEVLAAAMNSKDPGQVLGQFLLQLGSQMGEQMPEGMELNPKVMLASGGWLEQMSDFLQDEYDVPRDVADRAEIYVGSQAQAMAQAQQQQAQGGQPQAAPPVPQGAMNG